MRSFCTLFDKNYLYQGVALYQSLERFCNDFRLYALCMDQRAHAMLTRLGLERLVPIAVDDLLNEEVSAVRSRTTHGQFCWVCQPLICRHVLDAYGCDMVTYLEADSLFFSDPEPLFQELGAQSASLVPHNYAPGCDNTQVAGKFCVQFNAFRNDEQGAAVLEYWKASCFQYSKDRPLVYPGQTCLDDWPERFDCVRVLSHPGAGVAPWNIQRYRFEISNGTLWVDDHPVVFYHYHEYGRYANGAHELGNYRLPPSVIDSIYRTYATELAAAQASVQSVDPTFEFRRVYKNNITAWDLLRAPGYGHLRQYAHTLRRRVRGTYNVFPVNYFARNEEDKECSSGHC